MGELLAERFHSGPCEAEFKTYFYSTLDIIIVICRRVVARLGVAGYIMAIGAGSGVCKELGMARMTNTLSAWITRILGFDSSAQAYRDYQWVNLEMAARFHPRPSDPIWKLVTPPIAELVQQGFMKINLRCRLQQFQDTNKLPDEVIETISGVANEVGEANNLNPIFIILVTHQYVDADPWMRQLYKNAWVAAMVDRNNMAPPPESYLKYINTTYFAN